VKRVLLVALAILAPLLATAAEGALFRTTFSIVSGRPLTPNSVTVEEVDRTKTVSIIEVSTNTGDAGLVPDAALVGLCGLARHRGERYIQARQISKSPLTLEVTFPKVGSESAIPSISAMAPNVFSVASCPPHP
jgi:hypothetical protein